VCRGGERDRARRKEGVRILDVDEVLAVLALRDAYVARNDPLAGLDPGRVEEERRGPWAGLLRAFPEPFEGLAHAVAALDVLLPCALPGLLERYGAVEGGNGHREKALHQVGVENRGDRRGEEVLAEDLLPGRLDVEGRGAL